MHLPYYFQNKQRWNIGKRHPKTVLTNRGKASATITDFALGDILQSFDSGGNTRARFSGFLAVLTQWRIR
jgi:hypothetical protein